MSEEKLISGRYQVNVKTARKIKLLAFIKRVKVSVIVRTILEEHIEEVMPDSTFIRWDGEID